MINLPGIDAAQVLPSWPHVLKENSSTPITMKMYIVNKLQEMKDNGASWQRSAQADKVLNDLSMMIPQPEYSRVVTARGHYLTGEGRAELDQVCNELMMKYRQDTPPRNFNRTII